MPPEVDPSSLTPHEISKLSKKDLAQHLSALQDMFTEQREKYGAFRPSLPDEEKD